MTCKREWISVEDRLPNTGDYCLVFSNDITDGWIDMARPAGSRQWEKDGRLYMPIVSHWQPLPEPPS